VAAERLATHGPNELPAATGRSALLRFLAQFNNALIYFLLVAAVAAFLLGHLVDAVVIVAVVIVNAVVGFIQEGKAEKALNAIRNMIAPSASVLRDGERRHVAVRDLVPGDIVYLEAGDRVPADLRLLRSRRLLIDEALLTGESVAAEKTKRPFPPIPGWATAAAWLSPGHPWLPPARALASWSRPAWVHRSAISASCCRTSSR
jgi:ATPase, P-type (transporting), HAD superfamily, subfamily IC